MMMTLLGERRAGETGIFLDLFKLRYDVFVQRRQWSIPTRNGLDIDEYDTRQAIYFVERSDNGAIESHVRLNPTMGQSLLADYFPHLVEIDTPARGARIWEATRCIVQPKNPTRARVAAARARLMVRMLQWAEMHGVEYIQAVIGTHMLQHFVQMTEEIIPLGLSHVYGGGPDVPGVGQCMAIRWPVTEKTIADIAQFGRIGRSTAPCGR